MGPVRPMKLFSTALPHEPDNFGACDQKGESKGDCCEVSVDGLAARSVVKGHKAADNKPEYGNAQEGAGEFDYIPEVMSR